MDVVIHPANPPRVIKALWDSLNGPLYLQGPKALFYIDNTGGIHTSTYRGFAEARARNEQMIPVYEGDKVEIKF